MRRGRRAKPLDEVMNSTLHMRISRLQQLNLDRVAVALNVPTSTLARSWLKKGAAEEGVDLDQPVPASV